MSNVKIFIFELPNLFWNLSHLGRRTLLFTCSQFKQYNTPPMPHKSLLDIFPPIFVVVVGAMNIHKMDLLLSRANPLLQHLRTGIPQVHSWLVMTYTVCVLTCSVLIFRKHISDARDWDIFLLSGFTDWPWNFQLGGAVLHFLLLSAREGSLRDTEHVESVGSPVFTPDSSWCHQKGEGNEA